ncbi:NPC intracellular cholesterol transporter 2-like [Petromyzon marinus]|uniref:NPC intracellular cholesterol transporter 2-like n=1 Tax=Petromyzon marinus TaxID=7757 RepID=UPI003F70F99B
MVRSIRRAVGLGSADPRALCRAAGVVSNTATAVVHSIVAGFPVRFSIPQSDGCKSGLRLPARRGPRLQLRRQGAPVKSSYPNVSSWTCIDRLVFGEAQIKLVVKWQLKDDNGKDLFCFKFPVKIVRCDF